MTLDEALDVVKAGGDPLKIFIPSIGRELLFCNLNTSLQKTLGKIASSNLDPYRSGMMRLSIFEEMLLEGKREFKVGSLKLVDSVAFFSQLHAMTSEGIITSPMNCLGCGKKFEISLDLSKVVENCKKYKPRKHNYSIDFGNVKYEFALVDVSWLDSLILQESVRQSSGALNDTAFEAENYYIFNKICLYIDSLKLNGNEVTGSEGQKFSEMPVPERMRLFDSMNQRITIDERNPKSLINFVSENFSDDWINQLLFSGTYSPEGCSCGRSLEGVITYDTFFAFFI